MNEAIQARIQRRNEGREALACFNGLSKKYFNLLEHPEENAKSIEYFAEKLEAAGKKLQEFGYDMAFRPLTWPQIERTPRTVNGCL